MKPPQGTEQHSPASIARRCLVDRATAGRWIAFGKLKPAHADHEGQYFAAADLDRLRAVAVEDIRQRCARLTGSERDKLAAFFTELVSLEAGNKAPTDGDRAEGENRAQRAIKLNASIERMQADVVEIEKSLREGAGATPKAVGFRMTFAASTVESAAGVIRGVTVAKSGVSALGKYVMLDAAGQITRDPALARKKLPITTDDRTLETVMGAAQDAGGRLKVREDHLEDVGARAGYIDNFKKVGDRVTGDLHLFESYRNRDVVLETAAKTPQLIGLSMDFLPTYEISGSQAIMRVEELNAVDIVDQGAITPDGMK